MKTTVKYLLSTSMLDDSAKAMAAHGYHLDEHSFIKIIRITDKSLAAELVAMAGQDLLVVFTSKHAVEAVSAMLSSQPLHWRIACIGHATQQLVNTLFPSCPVVARGNNARDLAGQIMTNCDDTELYFFCGDMHLPDLPGTLNAGGRIVHERVVYATIETPLKVDRHYHGILFFSPSAVRSFFSFNILDASTVLFATGATTAAELSMHSSNEIVVGNSPGKAQLVNDAINYFADHQAAQTSN